VATDLEIGKGLQERRREQFLIHKFGKDIVKREQELAERYGISFEGLRDDWKCRGVWLGDLLGLPDVCLLSEVVTGEFQAYVEECWRTAEVLKEKGNWSSYNNLMKNLREMLVEKSKLLQSLGDLPRQAQELHVETREVTVASESERRVLNEAARILNQKDGGQKRPESLH